MENKIVYKNIPYGANEEAVITVSNKQSFVDLADLKRDIIVPKKATLEYNRWALNSDYKVFPDNPTGLKYMSSIMSDENCNFAQAIVLTRTYANTYTAPRNTNGF